MRRGDIVICAISGDFGKPRPAVVVQSDLFNDYHNSIVVCPITTHIIDADLFRLTVYPNKKNGLQKHSQIMVDKLTAIKAEKISKTIGTLSINEQHLVNDALKVWLDLS